MHLLNLYYKQLLEDFMSKEKSSITRSRPDIWDKHRMFNVIENMVAIPNKYDGLRRSGCAAEPEIRAYLEQEFKDMGITEVSQMDVPFCKETYTSYKLAVANEEIPCFFLRGADFTDAAGVKAEVIYVGSSIKGHDVKGKIVLMDVSVQDIDLDAFSKSSRFTLDNTGFFEGKSQPIIIMSANWPTEYYAAAEAGAVGILVTLPYESGTDRFYPDVCFRVERKIPGLYLGKFTGQKLAETIKQAKSPLEAHITLEGNVDSQAKSANVIGFLKGETDDAIIISSHIDGSFNGAVQDASGVSVVLALAAFYAEIPSYYRQKDLYFVLDANHYEWNYPQGANVFFDRFPHLLDKACLNIAIEHIGINAEPINGRYESTGETDLATLVVPQNDSLLTITKMAMQKHNLDRTIIPSRLLAGVSGEGRAAYLNNIPTFNYGGLPEYLLLEDDRLELVDKDRLEQVTNVFLDIIDWAMYKPSKMLKKID